MFCFSNGIACEPDFKYFCTDVKYSYTNAILIYLRVPLFLKP